MSMAKATKTAVWCVLMSACIGFESNRVELDGALVSAESAQLTHGPLRGSTDTVVLDNTADELRVRFAIVGPEGDRAVRLSLHDARDLLQLNAGWMRFTAGVLAIDGMTPDEGVSTGVMVTALDGRRFRVRFSTSVDERNVEGTVVLAVEG